jgi:hypothetical protein
VTFKDGSGIVTGTVHYPYDTFDRRIAQMMKDAVGNISLDERYVYDGNVNSRRQLTRLLAPRFDPPTGVGQLTMAASLSWRMPLGATEQWMDTGFGARRARIACGQGRLAYDHGRHRAYVLATP